MADKIFQEPYIRLIVEQLDRRSLANFRLCSHYCREASDPLFFQELQINHNSQTKSYNQNALVPKPGARLEHCNTAFGNSSENPKDVESSALNEYIDYISKRLSEPNSRLRYYVKHLQIGPFNHKVSLNWILGPLVGLLPRLQTVSIDFSKNNIDFSEDAAQWPPLVQSMINLTLTRNVQTWTPFLRSVEALKWVFISNYCGPDDLGTVLTAIFIWQGASLKRLQFCDKSYLPSKPLLNIMFSKAPNLEKLKIPVHPFLLCGTRRWIDFMTLVSFTLLSMEKTSFH